MGQILCWVTGIMLLGVPYKYWLYASMLEHFTLRAFSGSMLGLLAVHLLLAVVFLEPSMTQKYLRSCGGFARKIGVRLLALAAPLLLGLDGLLFLYRQNVELPALLAGVTPQQWIMALTLWIGPYLSLLVLPGAYLRELNVRYELRKLRLPIKTGAWIRNGKANFYPIGSAAKREMAAFAAQTGLPTGKAQNRRPVGLLMLVLGLPIFPVMFGVVPALKRGSFLPNAELEALSSGWMLYVAAYAFFLLVLRAYLERSTKAVLWVVLGPPLIAIALWPLSALHGLPILHAELSEQGPEIERQFTVLPQPSRLAAIFESACLNPLLATDSAGRTVYLCGLRVSASDGVRTGSVIGLRGRETDYGFYHDRKISGPP
jgi:hypothetical protein